MRIAEISANYGRGGPGGVMQDLTVSAYENGYECRVYYGRGNCPQDVDSERIGSDLSVYMHVLQSRALDRAGFASRYATKKLVDSLKSYRPDVIHLHNLLGYYLDVETLFTYFKTSGIPVVWTLHDCWALTGHCITFERAFCEKWKTGCFDCPLKKDYPESYIFDRSKNNQELKKKLFCSIPNLTLVTPSEWLFDLVGQSFLKEQARYVINNGIDIDYFKPKASDLRKKYGIDDHKVLLAVAGVWNEMKGIHLIKQLAERIDPIYKIVVIGDSQKYSLPDSVIRLERTENREQLVQWYTAADMLINPTFGDNFPTVNIEALACGTPVVTNLTGGSGEAAGDRYGRVVKSKNVEEFIAKIKECDNERYSSDEIRNYAMRYDKKICSQKYFDLFKSVTGGKGWHY